MEGIYRQPRAIGNDYYLRLDNELNDVTMLASITKQCACGNNRGSKSKKVNLVRFGRDTFSDMSYQENYQGYNNNTYIVGRGLNL